MEAGYDYLLERSRLQNRFLKASGILLVVIGTVCVGAGIAYYVYADRARAGLDDFNYTVQRPQADPFTTFPTTNTGPESVVTTPPVSESLRPANSQPFDETRVDASYIGSAGGTGQVPTVDRAEASTFIGPEEPPPIFGSSPVEDQPAVEDPGFQISPSAIASQQIYPDESAQATCWSNPLECEAPSSHELSLLQGFRPVDPLTVPNKGALAAPTRIIIPSIGVDSSVASLQILDLGSSRAYETPKHTVGHIPELANPGERGSAWLFGHLESPIAGEGNVFYNLPKIPDLLRKGREVYVILYSGSTSYLYRIFETKVVHQDDMVLYDTGGPNVHLVACVPRLVYDHRIVVTGELVGVRT